jgi:CRP/FNR family transcriptional regulator
VQQSPKSKEAGGQLIWNWFPTCLQADKKAVQQIKLGLARDRLKVQQQMSSTAYVQVRNGKMAKSNGHTAPNQPGAVRYVRERSVESDWGNGTVRRIEAKGHLFKEGDTKTYVYKVASGAVCIYKMLADGRRQIIEFAFEGDIIGLGSAPLEACNAQAIVLTRLKCLPLATLLKAAKHDAKVALGLYEALAQELIATHEHLLCVGQRGATERLAAFLLILSRRNEVRGSDPETIKLPMTRVDIADFLGLTIETVSRTFSKLKSQGLIEIDQNTTIHLKNTDELKRLAEGGARV